MLSRHERKQLNIEFYTALGRIMQGSYSELAKRSSWLNYKTGIRGVFVRLQADKCGVYFFIDVEHKDEDIREMLWEQLVELKTMLTNVMQKELVWYDHYQKDDFTTISRIECRLDKGSIYDKGTWPEMLTFLKESLLAFDQFWAIVFDIFKALQD